MLPELRADNPDKKKASRDDSPSLDAQSQNSPRNTGPKKKIASYQDLLVWQKSMDLVAMSYKVVVKLPLNEQYGLSSQLRRAAGSVPANIAEGFGRWYAGEFIRFLLIANGSIKDLIAVRLGLVQRNDIEASMRAAAEISKMIFSLRDKLSK